MSSSAAASSYWRVAGYSYLKYSNMCADMVRVEIDGYAEFGRIFAHRSLADARLCAPRSFVRCGRR